MIILVVMVQLVGKQKSTFLEKISFHAARFHHALEEHAPVVILNMKAQLILRKSFSTYKTVSFRL